MTHRETARRLQYVTGHGAHGNLPDNIDWQSLADPGVTTVVLYAEKDGDCGACHAGYCRGA
jgi:uroporphyrin-III C-methyltransferase/precorrin-2 dehydrogenase/sirohydrochlorin ferrochelatase